MTAVGTLGPATAQEIQLKVGWDRLRAIANEVGTTIYRTAFSPVVRDLRDFGVAILNADGQMLTTSDIGTPGHMNPLQASCACVLDTFGPDGLYPGDVVILNDPWWSSGHLLDIAVVTPIFREDDLVGFVGNICHYTDVGGLGMSTFGNDIYEEGLFIPPLKLFERGTRDEALYKLMLANVRRSQLFAGDIDAAIAANELGCRGILRVLGDLRLTDLGWLGGEILRRSELAMREAISQLKQGVYVARVDLDALDLDGPPQTVCVAVTVRDDEIVVDYDGTCDQVRRGVNSTLAYTTGYTQYGVRLAVTDRLPNNSGTLAPIKVLAPERSLLNAQHPAPTACRHMTAQCLPTLVLSALAEADPPFCIADSCGPPSGLSLIPDEGVAALLSLSVPSGTGARRTRDGLTARFFPANLRTASIEMTEQDGFYRFIRFERRRGSGGRGVHCGGDGITLEIELSETASGVAELSMERTVTPPRGLFGGEDGAPGSGWHNGESIASKFRARVKPGDRFVVHTGGGGGWGSPEGGCEAT